MTIYVSSAGRCFHVERQCPYIKNNTTVTERTLCKSCSLDQRKRNGPAALPSNA